MKVGLDIVEIKALRIAIGRSGNLILENLFTRHELLNRDLLHLAGLFALKEALIKVNIIRPGEWLMIEVKSDKLGRPLVFKGGKLLKKIAVSVSHSKNTAVAIVIKY